MGFQLQLPCFVLLTCQRAGLEGYVCSAERKLYGMFQGWHYDTSRPDNLSLERISANPQSFSPFLCCHLKSSICSVKLPKEGHIFIFTIKRKGRACGSGTGRAFGRPRVHFPIQPWVPCVTLGSEPSWGQVPFLFGKQGSALLQPFRVMSLSSVTSGLELSYSTYIEWKRVKMLQHHKML